MKGYASEYERVRRKSGMKQAINEQIDQVTGEVREVDLDRITRAHDDYKRHIAAREQKDAKGRAEADARWKAQSLRFNKMIMLREWRAAGVVCPCLDAEGLPNVSLSMLMTLGWRIENRDDGPYLVKPPPPRPRSETPYREMGS